MNRKPILCYVTDRQSLKAIPGKSPMESLIEKIAMIAAAGVGWIQLREKDLSAREAASLTQGALRSVSRQAHDSQAHSPGDAVCIVVNDRLDVALSGQAGGVHLGENSLPMEEAKRLVAAYQATTTHSRNFLVGASCHSLGAAKSAADRGADYVFFGPIFATPSKAAYGAPQGLDRLAEVSSSLRIPVLAIGGINLENARSCLSAGASGIAAIRLFQDSLDPVATARELRQ